MGRKGFGLAARLKAAVEAEQGRLSGEEKERQKRREEAAAARETLFVDLQAIGSELGFAGVQRDPTGVRILKGDRWLHFTADGDDGSVKVDFAGRAEGAVHRVYRESALDGRWIWVRRRRSREDRLPLFDQGLELLLVHALDLPSPSDPADPDPIAEPADEPPPEDSTGRTRVKRTL